MGGFIEALTLVLIVAVASGHVGYDPLIFWSRPAIVEWKQNLAIEEKFQKNIDIDDRNHIAIDDRSSRNAFIVIIKS